MIQGAIQYSNMRQHFTVEVKRCRVVPRKLFGAVYKQTICRKSHDAKIVLSDMASL